MGSRVGRAGEGRLLEFSVGGCILSENSEQVQLKLVTGQNMGPRLG